MTQRKRFTELLELTAMVLASRETITTWIESSWTFERSPCIISRQSEENEILYIHRSDESVHRNIHNLVTMLIRNGSKHDDGFICVRSQVSADDTEIGTIKVKPPRPTTGIIADLDAECNPKDGVSTEDPIWRVRYEIWQSNPTN
jgi:hypothetical protein